MNKPPIPVSEKQYREWLEQANTRNIENKLTRYQNALWRIAQESQNPADETLRRIHALANDALTEDA
jgi:hypothetical protein